MPNDPVCNNYVNTSRDRSVSTSQKQKEVFFWHIRWYVKYAYFVHKLNMGCHTIMHPSMQRYYFLK